MSAAIRASGLASKPSSTRALDRSDNRRYWLPDRRMYSTPNASKFAISADSTASRADTANHSAVASSSRSKAISFDALRIYRLVATSPSRTTVATKATTTVWARKVITNHSHALVGEYNNFHDQSSWPRPTYFYLKFAKQNKDHIILVLFYNQLE
ncbi:hypothetical protein [Marinobacter sp. SS21]|uniref:hypothetical protein n=1 Tax=Marinobacter sp. SS21 TaxID=2979460 RepID=UPI00232D9543|nr:hypothetical protein [Marinobacter sp. SS21]MDC0662284.1 hypothetical protein [Marinobacter sp. SS21]